MCYFTVFTPTYNRAYCLERLKDSLLAQTFTDFEWLIIDDGSTDNTEDLVCGWQDLNLRIKYFKKVNGGKPRAINFGLQKANGRFFFLMDSDELLVPDALKKMYIWCKEIENEDMIIGVGAAKGYPNGKYLKGSAPYIPLNGYIDAAHLDRDLYNLDADMGEAYKTDLFKKFPMAEWPGENFAPEQIALYQTSLAGYKLRWHSDIIYIIDYLEDGLTKNSRILEKKNPMGYSMMYNHMLLYPRRTFWQKFNYACQSSALAIYGKNPKYILSSNKPALSIISLPLAMVLAVRRSLQYKKIQG